MDLQPPVKVPKKKAPVKRQASVLWEDTTQCQENHHEQKLTELVLQLQKRLNCLELGLQSLQEAMDHLLQDHSEEDLNLSS